MQIALIVMGMFCEFHFQYLPNLSKPIKIHYPIFDNLNKLMVSLLHEGTSEIGKKYFGGCHALWL